MFLCDLWLITNHRRQLQLPSQGPEFGSGMISSMHDFKQLRQRNPETDNSNRKNNTQQLVCSTFCHWQNSWPNRSGFALAHPRLLLGDFDGSMMSLLAPSVLSLDQWCLSLRTDQNLSNHTLL